MSLGRYRHIPLLANLRLRWDSINYNWHRAVIGFDSDTQTDLLSNWMGDISPLKMVLFVLISGGAIILLMTLHLWWTSRPAPKTLAQRYYFRFERALKRKGWVRQSGETAGDFAARIECSHQSVGEAVLSFTRLFESYEYADEGVSRQHWNDALMKVQRSLKAL